MITVFLRFADKATAIAALADAGMTTTLTAPEYEPGALEAYDAALAEWGERYRDALGSEPLLAYFKSFDDWERACDDAMSGIKAERPSHPDPIGGRDEVNIAMNGTVGGTRFDLALVGGDGAYRTQTGTETREVAGLGTIETPVFTTQPGFFVNLLWHGEESDLPDFGAAQIHPKSPSQVFAA